jgi:hypothetical protein
MSILVADLTACDDGSTERNGRIRLEVADSGFCTGCVLVPGVAGAQTLTAYRETRSDGLVLEVEDGLEEEFELRGRSCLGAELNDRRSQYRGRLRETSAETDLQFSFGTPTPDEPFVIDVASRVTKDGSCEVTTLQTGRAEVDDAIADRRFVQSGQLETIERIRTDESREVTLDTPGKATFSVDCLGGEVELATLVPFLFPPDSRCASAGLLQVTFSFSDSRQDAAIRSAPDGSLEFDYEFDGTFSPDDSAACNDSQRFLRGRVPSPDTTPCGTSNGNADAGRCKPYSDGNGLANDYVDGDTHREDVKPQTRRPAPRHPR